MADASLWDVWDAIAEGRPLTGKNAFVRENLVAIRADVDLAALQVSPGQSPLGSPTGTTFTPAAGQITVAGTAPTAPSGWTLVQAHAIAIQEADPSAGTAPTDYGSGTDVTSPFSIVIANLLAGEYIAAIYMEYESTANPSLHRFGRAVIDTTNTVPNRSWPY
jgi:hypothetical protein